MKIRPVDFQFAGFCRNTAQCFLLCLVVMAFAVPARAHTKWFVEFDITKAPAPIGQVLTATFIKFFLLSLVGVYLFFLADRYGVRKSYLSALDERLRHLDSFSIYFMRASTGLFLVSLGLWHLKFGTTFYLTPELKTAAAWVPWLHLGLGACLLWRYTTPIAGLGVFLLYGLAVNDYGAYHMLDYVAFLGIGYFLLVSNLRAKPWVRSGFIVLFAGTGLTLVWAAVEKFAYPQWTYPLLAQNPGMLMGMSPSVFLVLSGFIEFNLAFVLLGAVSVAGRMVALGMESIFVLAIFKFGKLDAIGHLMLIAVLFILLVRGPTDARNLLLLRDKSIWTEAYFMAGLYVLDMVLIFILYYGLHYLYYRV